MEYIALEDMVFRMISTYNDKEKISNNMYFGAELKIFKLLLEYME